jgi:hypothetical protein
MTSTTPLLLLLDSILSQESERIREARNRIRQVVAKVDPGLAARPVEQGPSFLIHDVDMLLTAFPNLASVQSSHDGSLPLHFAASIGDVQGRRSGYSWLVYDVCHVDVTHSTFVQFL